MNEPSLRLESATVVDRSIKCTTKRCGIQSLEAFKARTIAIAKGEYHPKPNEPKIWFSSIKSAASVLSEENQALLKIIHEHNPESIAELEPLTGRKASNLSRTLTTLAHYHIVRMEKVTSKQNKKGRPRLKPVLEVESVSIDLHFA